MFVDRIYSDFPQLNGIPAIPLGTGWDFETVTVGGVAFRFPRRPELRESLRKEIALLRRLSDFRPPCQIPHYEFIPASLDYAGYRLIPGACLPAEDFRRLPTPAADRTAEDLSAFLNWLHSIPLDSLSTLGLAASGKHYTFSPGFVRRSLENVPEDRRRDAEKLLARFNGLASVDGTTDVLCHYDLRPENLVIDPITGALAGVIDFSDAAPFHPAADFRGILAAGQPFFTKTLAGYSARPRGEILRWAVPLSERHDFFARGALPEDGNEIGAAT